MTKTQKIQLAMSEKRQRLNELLGIVETRSEEQQSELETLTGEIQKLEPELRAAIAAAPDPVVETRTNDTPEGRELRELTARASAGDIFRAALEHRSTEGATREIQDHFKLGSNQVPLAMLQSVEHRAVTPAPADVGTQQAEIIPYVFPQSCAAFLGIDTPTVPAGDAVYPVLKAKLAVGAPAENADQDETTGEFTADVLTPGRLQASFFFSREDRARFMGMDEALRMNLGDGLGDGLDRQILVGDEGLLHGTNLANHNAGAVSNFAHYKSNLGFGRVDGRFAGGALDVRSVMGSATFAHAATIYRANNSDDSALDVLMAKTGGVKVSAHVPAVAGNKQNVAVRLGLRRDMVAAIWDGVTIIPDEVTKAKGGQIVITAVMLHAIKILRADGFYKQQTQHA